MSAVGFVGPPPPPIRQHLANIARWFPEVVLALGALDLEDRLSPTEARLIDTGLGCTLEVELDNSAIPPLQRVASPPMATDPRQQYGAVESVTCYCPTPDIALAAVGPIASSWVGTQSRTQRGLREQILDNIDQLAGDFEVLSVRLGSMPPMLQAQVASMQRSASPLLVPAPPQAGVAVAASQRDVASRLHAVESGIIALVATLEQAHLACDAPSGAYGNPVTAGAGIAHDVPQARPPPMPVQVDDEVAVKRGGPSRNLLGAQRSKSLDDGWLCSPSCAGSSASPGNGRENPTPRSARGGQAHQGSVDGGMGRSRTLGNTKATSFRSKQELTIAISKVQQLPQEPMSPKLVTKPKVWGPAGAMSSKTVSFQDNSAVAIKERMEKRLAEMFGKNRAAGNFDMKLFLSG
mmetsp:Transcript_19055/g.38495  ORF Transcript_19055/g.38495 Transcript_19055/m.38495 type:complete len:407 (-) Transcript_19055:212-1432(-)|eukprot:CAMPEP_0170213280 /NCGR_PEP_ID=MMETSP0116_2-20130129/6263_1 /TAXON_ID=400756 /ORGANISM="Durinskia baltica, Strain CSIRO CS-38" /LENGTH=406 /DNA_ID=CAMNT_0010463829 /DNA_START=59 /DNA_END=1279 /DNA_ORIENTATION=-